MKIYVSHSREFDFKEELYKPIRESDLDKNHEFFLPHENDSYIDAKEIIKNSNLLLAEVSFPSTGQGIELGWADMLNIPIVCIHKEGSKISSSLKSITEKFFTYKDSSDLIVKIANLSN